MGRFIARSVCGFVLALSLTSVTAEGATAETPTHKQARSIKPEIEGLQVHLNTYCLATDGNLWMCCTVDGNKGAIVITSPEGKNIKTVELDFAPQAINFAKDGQAFIAGSGKVAKLSSDGEVLQAIEAPNLANPEEALAKMRIAVEKQVEEIVSQAANQIKTLEETIAKLEEAPEDETETAKKRRLTRLEVLKRQKETQAGNQAQMREMYTKAYASQMSIDRLKRATGLAVSNDEIFVSLPSPQGFGYSIWRMTHELKDPVVVTDNVGGCCGQMDIQSDGENILVAANTKFQVIRYDREGKQLSNFGERNRAGGSGFGSCCNPMNIRCCENGEILTAESSIGHIKRFSADGKYLGLVGTAKIGGGCKHVAVSHDAKRDTYYIMNIDRGDVAVLVPADQIQGETEEEKLTREAREGLGKKLIGAWQIKRDAKKKPAETTENNAEVTFTIDDYASSQYQYVRFTNDGGLSTVSPQAQASQASQGSQSSFAAQLLSIFSASKQEKKESSAKTAVAARTVTPPDQQWEAIAQKGDRLQVVTIQQEVRGYNFVAKFVDDKTMHVTWFYGSNPPPEGTNYVVYERISAPDCQSGLCSGDHCGCGEACSKDQESK